MKRWACVCVAAPFLALAGGAMALGCGSSPRVDGASAPAVDGGTGDGASDSASDSAGETGITATPAELASAQCDHLQRCYGVYAELGNRFSSDFANRSYRSREDCLAGEKDLYEAFDRAPGSTLHGEARATCLAALAQAPCIPTPSDLLTTLAACMPPGKSAVGAPCSLNMQCASGVCGQLPNSSCGACVAGPAALGGPCASAAQCAFGTACSHGRCELGPANGESCATDPASCRDGFCKPDKTCGAPLSEGAPCEIQMGFQGYASVCAAGLSCFGVQPTCKRIYPTLGSDAPCGTPDGKTCAPGYYCLSVCTASSPLGSPCLQGTSNCYRSSCFDSSCRSYSDVAGQCN